MRVLAKSRKTASICTRNMAAVSLQRWHGKIYAYLRKERQPVLAKPYRVESRAFSSISRQTACTRRRNFTRNRAISRVPARRYAISWVRARFALSHTISHKCNQQFRSGVTVKVHSHEIEWGSYTFRQKSALFAWRIDVTAKYCTVENIRKETHFTVVLSCQKFMVSTCTCIFMEVICIHICLSYAHKNSQLSNFQPMFDCQYSYI